MKQRILLLEDDPNLGFVLQEHLEALGFAVTLKSNGEEGIVATRRNRFVLCLVDVMMPKKDGFTFAREFRSIDASTPIIFLTAKGLREDRIEGFKAGGDDYVTKPFSMEELMLRIRAVLKRSVPDTSVRQAPGNIRLGSILFNKERQTLTQGSRKQALTTREAELLYLLASRLNSVVVRSEILTTIWQEDSYYNSRSLDVFVSRLRKYLASDPAVEIRSVHGKGYKLIVES